MASVGTSAFRKTRDATSSTSTTMAIDPATKTTWGTVTVLSKLFEDFGQAFPCRCVPFMNDLEIGRFDPEAIGRGYEGVHPLAKFIVMNGRADGLQGPKRSYQPSILIGAVLYQQGLLTDAHQLAADVVQDAVLPCGAGDALRALDANQLAAQGRQGAHDRATNRTDQADPRVHRKNYRASSF